MFKRLGKGWNALLCWMELHDWYEGVHSIYCVREGCPAFLPKLGMDFAGVHDASCDDTNCCSNLEQ